MKFAAAACSPTGFSLISLRSTILTGRTPLAFQALRHRFLWRQRAPISPGEIRRTERWLATARVFLAISALVAVWLDPGEIGYSSWVYWFVMLYITHGV